MTSFYTVEEVAKHNHEQDLWIIIHNGVYDLTKFLNEHPGGVEVLLNLAGGDGTDCFDEIGHSVEAQQLCQIFKIGNIEGTDLKEGNKKSTKKSLTSKQPNVTDDEPWDSVEHEKKSVPWIVVLLGLASVVYAIISYYMII